MREHYTHTFGPPLDRFVTLAVGYRYAGGSPGVHVGLPSGALTLVVPFDEPLWLSGGGLGPTPFEGVLAGLSCGAALWGLHLAFSQGLLATLIADCAPAELRGTAFGVFNLLTGASLLAASVLAGRLWDTVGARGTFLVGALLAAVALLGVSSLKERRVVRSQ